MTFLDIRRQRLVKLRKTRPDYAEVYDFYERLYGFFGKESADWLRIQPDLVGAARRLESGLPLLSAEFLHIDQGQARDFLVRLTEVLAQGGRQGQDELRSLGRSLASGELDPAGLLRSCFVRERKPLDEAAVKAAVEASLVEFVFSMALGFGLQVWVEKESPQVPEAWNQGCCPICGALPVMGELKGEEGRKTLHCSLCATAWAMPRLHCSFCGNNDPASLEYFTAGQDTAHRVNVCRKCSCYLKVVDSRQAGENLPMDVEDLSTLHLDMLAQGEGFTRAKMIQSGTGN